MVKGLKKEYTKINSTTNLPRMGKYKTLFTVSMYSLVLLCGLSLKPWQAAAQTISLQGVLPEVDEDITPPDNQKAAEENFYTFWFKGQIGTEYQANFTVSEEPAFTFVSGGNMTMEDNIHYNAEEQTFTVTYTAEVLEQIDSQSGLELDEGQTLTIIAISFPVEEGESGPGESTIGSWVATNFQEWTLITPSAESNGMGAEVRGDVGDTGQFKMFMPQVAIDVMAEYDNAEAGDYDASDFATYEDDALSEEEVTQVTGGALLNFTATIPESSEVTSQDASYSSLTVEVAPKEAVSFTSDKTQVKKDRYVTFTGWIKSGKKGKTVTLLRRTEDTGYTQVRSTETTTGGKFTFTLKVHELSAFKAKFKTHKSQAISITIK